MLRRASRDESETTTRALRSVAKKRLATVGILTALRDVFVEQSQMVQLARDNTTKVEARAITRVGEERLGSRGEVRRDLRSNLVPLDRDARANERVHALGTSEVLEGARENAPGQPAPARVHDTEARRRLVDQEDRNAVSDQDGQRHVVTVAHQPVAFARDWPVADLDDLVAVDLAHRDESFGLDARGLGDATAIFLDVLFVIADVTSEVERLVRGFAHAAEAVREEGVNTQSAQCLHGIHAEGTSYLGYERYFDRHAGQSPLSSSTWRRSRKPWRSPMS